MTIEGSSPLARGLPRACEPSDPRRRIIPARAGFTTGLRAIGPTTSDHPRSRGVYRRCSCFARGGVGSSPLARGLPSQFARPALRRWIIPARAGFTRRSWTSPRTTGDHPRSHGVYTALVDVPEDHRGSSPLARGLQKVVPPTGTPPGIIPARAGFTSSRRSPPASCRDHPRSRGVYGWHHRQNVGQRGSSPLARGLRLCCFGLDAALRIIPARAGFTPEQHRHRTRSRDHPRSRGVYRLMVFMGCSLRGSSPLARGLRHRGRGDAERLGDHPRSRGVYRLMVFMGCSLRGSSPLARGLQIGHRLEEALPRIIPARAGFTGRAAPGRCRPGDVPRRRTSPSRVHATECPRHR